MYFADAQTSESESEIDYDDMLDWSASECKDYNEDAFATVACACPTDSPETHSDTWAWRGPCCLVRVHRQFRRCLKTPNRHDQIWQGLTAQPQQITHVRPIRNNPVKIQLLRTLSPSTLKSRKVAHPWTGETHARVAPSAQSESVFRTSARILAQVSDMNPSSSI